MQYVSKILLAIDIQNFNNDFKIFFNVLFLNMYYKCSGLNTTNWKIHFLKSIDLTDINTK